MHLCVKQRLPVLGQPNTCMCGGGVFIAVVVPLQVKMKLVQLITQRIKHFFQHTLLICIKNQYCLSDLMHFFDNPEKYFAFNCYFFCLSQMI